jgi:hypothetical protein
LLRNPLDSPAEGRTRLLTASSCRAVLPPPHPEFVSSLSPRNEIKISALITSRDPSRLFASLLLLLDPRNQINFLLRFLIFCRSHQRAGHLGMSEKSEASRRLMRAKDCAQSIHSTGPFFVPIRIHSLAARCFAVKRHNYDIDTVQTKQGEWDNPSSSMINYSRNLKFKLASRTNAGPCVPRRALRLQTPSHLRVICLHFGIQNN